MPPPTENELRVVNDMILTLWTAERVPEERFIETTITDYPTIQVPAESELGYALTVPGNGRFRVGARVPGVGQLHYKILFKRYGTGGRGREFEKCLV